MSSTVEVKEVEDKPDEDELLNEDDDNDDEDDDDAAGDVAVQLGYIEELDEDESEEPLLFLEEDWSKWDGGKVGGLPIWLDKTHVPLNSDVLCKSCSEPMSFLLEVYTPLDDNEAAFHRAIYLFCCSKASCVSSGSVIALRCQLPQRNKFYVEDVDQLEAKPSSKLASETFVQLCDVCGCRSLAACGRCGSANYCSKSHQKLDWKIHKHVCADKSASASSSSEKKSSANVNSNNKGLYPSVVFPEYCIVIDEENPDDLEKLTNDLGNTVIWDDAMISSEDAKKDGDRNITQSEYSEALGNEDIDEQYVKFLTRIDRGGKDQVLRYIRWEEREGPLFISSRDKKERSDLLVPPCDCCGGKRKFEFQVMPQLLYYITKCALAEPGAGASELGATMDALVKMTHTIDWGTIDVYTCVNSCNDDRGEIALATGDKTVSRYLKEFVVIQQPPAFKVQARRELTEEEELALEREESTQSKLDKAIGKV